MRTAFISSREARARLPVAILGGFLGSGKTTILNRLLQSPTFADTAVAINEFGEIPIDQHLIDGSTPEDTIVLANGCLCCNLSGDVESAILRLFARRQDGGIPHFRRLLIEPSGLVDLPPLVQALLRNPVLSATFRLEAIVVAVDAMFGPDQLSDHCEAAGQAALADCLLVTKTDLATRAATTALREDLRRRNPTAPIIDVVQGNVEPDDIFPAPFLDDTTDGDIAPRAPWSSQEVRADHRHRAGIGAMTLTARRPMHWTRFERWMKRLRLDHAERMLRFKGLVSIEGEPGPVVIQGVRHVLHPPVSYPRWPDGDRSSRLVLIGHDLPEAELEAGWRRLQDPEVAHASH